MRYCLRRKGCIKMSIDEILELMEELIEKSSTVPFSNKKMVDCEQMSEYIDSIRLNIPSEIKRAKDTARDRKKIIDDAKAAIEKAETAAEVDKILAETKATLLTVGCPSADLTDVEEGTWYHTGVDFMVKNGYMNGVSATTFGVEETLTRAQLVTILYRIAGSPEVEG